eukprot:9567546-Heterocapsa_arctica.AAC.1
MSLMDARRVMCILIRARVRNYQKFISREHAGGIPVRRYSTCTVTYQDCQNCSCRRHYEKYVRIVRTAKSTRQNCQNPACARSAS